MKILVFTEGTVLMHSSGLGVSPEQRVRQVKEKEASVKDYKNYIPIDDSLRLLKSWENEGAEIYYLTSRKSTEEVEAIKNVLEKYKFPNIENLLYRKNGQEYEDVVEELIPDIFIEDDCQSIGGEKEMTSTHFDQETKSRIKTIVVGEFEGTNHLPVDLIDLKKF